MLRLYSKAWREYHIIQLWWTTFKSFHYSYGKCYITRPFLVVFEDWGFLLWSDSKAWMKCLVIKKQLTKLLVGNFQVSSIYRSYLTSEWVAVGIKGILLLIWMKCIRIAIRVVAGHFCGGFFCGSWWMGMEMDDVLCK